MNTIQQFIIQLTDERTGPRGGKAKPLVTQYAVAATTSEEALACFNEECPAMVMPTTRITVSASQCRVMRI